MPQLSFTPIFAYITMTLTYTAFVLCIVKVIVIGG